MGDGGAEYGLYNLTADHQSGDTEPFAHPGAGRRQTGIFTGGGDPSQTHTAGERGYGALYRPGVLYDTDGNRIFQ